MFEVAEVRDGNVRWENFRSDDSPTKKHHYGRRSFVDEDNGWEVVIPSIRLRQRSSSRAAHPTQVTPERSYKAETPNRTLKIIQSYSYFKLWKICFSCSVSHRFSITDVHVKSVSIINEIQLTSDRFEYIHSFDHGLTLGEIYEIKYMHRFDCFSWRSSKERDLQSKTRKLPKGIFHRWMKASSECSLWRYHSPLMEVPSCGEASTTWECHSVCDILMFP